MMYNGVLTGFGSYVNKEGDKVNANFYRDKLHGNVHVTDGDVIAFMMY